MTNPVKTIEVQQRGVGGTLLLTYADGQTATLVYSTYSRLAGKVSELARKNPGVEIIDR